MKQGIRLVALLGILALFNTQVLAQDKDKDRKEYEKKEHKEHKKHKEKERNSDERYESGRSVGDILGRVILPRNGSASPRQLVGVPKGHYPPPGSCRVWYPNRPAGHQPPPTRCDNLYGLRLERGAFILHGDRAYDAEYDWREEERRRPGSVARDILDILFPNRR